MLRSKVNEMCGSTRVRISSFSRLKAQMLLRTIFSRP